MRSTAISARVLIGTGLLVLAACQDLDQPLAPAEPESAASVQGPQPSPRAIQALEEVLAMRQTVYGGRDAAGRLVIGVENEAVARGVAGVLQRFGIAPADYEVRITEPIHFAATLRDAFRPVVAGVQIHWSNYVCTLGFNVDHADGRSFITNSHCTENQGSTGSTAYYQPFSGAQPTPIAIEDHDPAYTKGGGCSRGKVCRYSDASRALYQPGIESRAEIARTTGENSGSLEVAGVFEITAQDNSSTTFSGTVHKVGRTTGWTSGAVLSSCATVNVSGSNIQLRCQTLVENDDAVIVGGGDSGSPVFRYSGSNATLLGILWGGSTSGNLFVFSPLKNIQDELGPLNALNDGIGGDGGPDDGGDGGECIPRGKSGNCG